jgi:glycosyltransferase involved in cell wall biosynthesis
VLPQVSNLEMRELFSKARVSISLSISDGLPGALVEAMWAGAFPIQSKDSAAGEFLRQGENGFVVDPWDLKSIEIALREVLLSDDLVDEASNINMRLLSKNFSLNEGIAKLKNLYLEGV